MKNNIEQNTAKVFIENKKLINKYEKQPLYCDIYTLKNVKVIIDDFILEYLENKKFIRDFKFDNIKILIGIMSGIFSIVITILSVLYKWEFIHIYIKIMVVSYYSINFIWYIINYLENDNFILKKNNKKINIKTNINMNGIYSISHEDKLHKINIFDIIYENGKLDIYKTLELLNKIFK